MTQELARAQAQMGHHDAVTTAHQAVELANGPDERAAAQLHLARTIGLFRGFGSAASLLDQIRKSTEVIAPDLALQLEAELLGLARLDGKSYQQAVARLETLAPRAVPARPATVLLLANLALSALERNEHPSKILQRAELALSQGWLIAEGSLQLLYAVTTLIWIDQLDAAARACDQIGEVAKASGSVSLASIGLALKAQLNLRRG